MAGTRLPLDRLLGLDFALTALFVVLAIEAFRATRDLPTASLAVVCAIAAQALFPQQMLLAALTLFAGLLVGRIGRLAGQLPLGVMMILALSIFRGVSLDDAALWTS